VYRTLKPLGKSDFEDEKKRYLFHLLLHLGESVSVDPGLQLGHGLIAPLEAAFLEAPVDTDGQVVRDLKKYDVSE